MAKEGRDENLGRKPLPPGAAREKNFIVKVTPRDHARFKAAGGSTWAYNVLLKAFDERVRGEPSIIPSMLIRISTSQLSDDVLRVEVGRLPVAGDVIEVDSFGGSRVYVARSVGQGEDPLVRAFVSEGEEKPTMKGWLV